MSTVESTGSTNLDLVAAVERGAAGDGSVLRAEHQTRGRGRLDRTWDAPAGANLLASIVFGAASAHPVRLTQAVGVAALDAVEDAVSDRFGEVVPGRLGLKWPNDVLLDDRKLAGVLAQRTSTGAVVVGIGLNIAWSPPGAAQLVADLELEVSPAELLDRLLRRLTDFCELPDERQHARYVRHLATIGRRVRLELPSGDDVVADAVGVDLDGRLLLTDRNGGSRVVDVGDITHLRMLSDDPA